MLDCGQSKKGGHRRRLSALFRRMTRPGAPYAKMDGDGKKGWMEEKGKENVFVADVVKESIKPNKKRSWKRVRQVALTTCRYIGMGAIHMSPATLYSNPDYSVDPKCWNGSFNPHGKPKRNDYRYRNPTFLVMPY